MYLCCFTESQNSLKNSFGNIVFQIVAKIEMTQNKNKLFAHHFEMVKHKKHFKLFLQNYDFFYSAYIYGYMVQISL